jgi:hypothetical protein
VALLAAPMVALLLGFELAVHSWYRSWVPSHMFPPGNDAFAISPTRGIAAASFDAASGLFTNNPGLLLILAGLPLWYRLARGPFLRLALAVGPTILLEATFNDWSAGFTPPGRYALQFTPVFVPAVGLLLRAAPRWLSAAAGVVIGAQCVLAVAYVWLQPSWVFAGMRSPFFAALDDRLGLPLDRLMPTFGVQAALTSGGWQLAVWLLVAALVAAGGVALARGRPAAPAG